MDADLNAENVNHRVVEGGMFYNFLANFARCNADRQTYSFRLIGV